MSASNRKITRLPLDIFRDLDSDSTDPESLRSTICGRLKRFPVKVVSRNGSSKTTTSATVKTVGDLLRTSKGTLLRALDPHLTYGKFKCFAEKIVSLKKSYLPVLFVQKFNNAHDAQRCCC